MPSVSHHPVEAAQPTDRAQQQKYAPSAGVAQAQHEAWGPQSVARQKTNYSENLPPLAHVTIEDSSQNDTFRNLCAKPFNEIPPPPGLKNAEQELAKAGNADHLLGIQVGTVKAVYGIANGAIELGNAVISPAPRFGNWLANTIVRPELAISDSAKFGNDVGSGIVAGIKTVQAVDAYATAVKHAQENGDYLKPFNDASTVLKLANEKFKTLTPGQQTAAISEQVVSLGTQVAAGKIFATAAEGIASVMQKMDQFKAKSDSVRAELGLTKELQSATHDVEAQAHAHEFGGEKHLAGGQNSRFKYEEIEAKRSPDVPIQCHKNACVAAVGEMLTEGKIDQQSLVQRLEKNFSEELRGKESLLSLLHLATELQPSGFVFKTVSKERNIDFEPLLKELLSTSHPFAVTLKAYQVDAHAVVVDGINSAGRLLIRDPGDGKMYQMTMKDFMDHWTGQAVARKTP